MMSDTLISVVVPAYNNGPWLPRTLDSLLAQTYKNLEILVVNDGSRDDTGAVAEGYAEKYQNIRVFHQENAGVTSARLRGAAAARGEFIGFVDGDDQVEPWMYERLLELAEKNGADVSHCGQQVIFPDGRVSRVTDSGEIRIQDHLTALRDLLDGGIVESGLCTKLYRRTLFEGLEDRMDLTVKNNEDLLMNFYLFSRSENSVFEAVCPYHYILRQGSASYRRPPRESLIRDSLRVRQKILAACPPELEKDGRRALLRNCLFLYSCLAVVPGREYDGGRRLVRSTLRENREHFGILSRRNRLLASLICTAPRAFDLAFRAYAALFRRQEQH